MLECKILKKFNVNIMDLTYITYLLGKKSIYKYIIILTKV